MPAHPERVRRNYYEQDTPNMHIVDVPAIQRDVKALLDLCEWYVLAQVPQQFNTRQAQEAAERLREWVG